LISKLEEKVDSILHISKDQIDSLETNPLQAWPLYADSYLETPSNPTEGYKVLIPSGIKEFVVENGVGSWYNSPVVDGVMYIVKSDMHIYKYNKKKGLWNDQGFYGNA
jgi:hypothetical protein